MHSPSLRSIFKPIEILRATRLRATTRLRAIVGALVLSFTTQCTTAWEIDFHYYTVYLLLRARGYSTNDSQQLAGFSQYIDDNAYTEPMFQPYEMRAKFHFIGSAENQATVHGGEDGQKRITEAFDRFAANPDTGKFHVGAALHLMADSFSHATFTAWWNSAINRREDSWLRPDIGHADAYDNGHRPDWPHRDSTNALAAAHWLYEAIPPGKLEQVPWEKLNDELKAAFSATPSDGVKPAEFRIPLITKIITNHFSGDKPNYAAKNFDNQYKAFKQEMKSK